MKLGEVLYIIYTDSAGERGSLLSWDVSKDHSKPKSFILFLRVTRFIPSSSGSVPLITICSVALRRDFAKQRVQEELNERWETVVRTPHLFPN